MSEILERVFSYCDDILNISIKACKKHKRAVKRFLKDYEDCQNEGSLFYFDEIEVEDFYWFSREFKHVEGVLEGQNVELTDFQLVLSANIFGFKKRRNGARRFRKVDIELARKNAKAQFLAIIAAYITFLGDERDRAYIAGWTRDQSSEVYDAIRTGIGSSDLLAGKWKEAYGKIEILKNKSVIVPLSKEARKTGDGKNPSVGIIDEYHAHETSEIYDVILSGMVARKEPLQIIITTAGFDLSRPCYTEYEYVSDILDPDSGVENDDYFVMICELDEGDDIKDESNWIKANPIVATYEEGLTSIRSDLKVALEVPEKMGSFLTKTMNIWVQKRQKGYMNMKKWKNCKVVNFDDDILTRIPLWIGVDLSATTDLTSVAWCGIDEEKTFIVGQHSFTPEARMEEKIKVDKVPYDVWEKQGYLTATPGEVVNLKTIENFIENFSEGKMIKEVVYDEWNALHLAQTLGEKGFTMVKMPQRIAHLSLPTKTFREEVYDGRVKHDGDPLLHWALYNAVTKEDDQENIMLSKKLSRQRIDPAAALINAFARAMYGMNVVDLNAYVMSDDFSF